MITDWNRKDIVKVLRRSGPSRRLIMAKNRQPITKEISDVRDLAQR